MKKITLIIPTSLKEVKENLQQFFKWSITHKRTQHNLEVFLELEKEVCNKLNSAYWDSDISVYDYPKSLPIPRIGERVSIGESNIATVKDILYQVNEANERPFCVITIKTER